MPHPAIARRRAPWVLACLAALLCSGCSLLAYEGYEDYFATPAVANPLSCKLLKASAYAYAVNTSGAITDPALSKLMDETGEGYGVVSGGQGQTGTDRDAAYVWHAGNEVIIVFRGTLPYPSGGQGSADQQALSVQDWLNDADYSAQPDPDLGTVHRGFLDAFNNLWPGIEQQLKAWAAAGRLPADVKVYVTGHSKGGALARLAALKLSAGKALPVTQVDTFGAPRVGGADFAARYGEAKLDDNRYENDLDVVPHVPLDAEEQDLLPLLQKIMSLGGKQPGDYVSVGQLHFIKSDGTIITPADAAAEAQLDGTRLASFGSLLLGTSQDAINAIVAAHSLGDLSKSDASRYFQAVCGALPKQ